MARFKLTQGKSGPAQAVAADPADIEAFAAGADLARQVHADPARPWVGKREGKGTEVFNLRLSEAQKARLDYISGVERISIHAWIMAQLESRILEEAERLFQIHGPKA